MFQWVFSLHEIGHFITFAYLVLCVDFKVSGKEFDVSIDFVKVNNKT